MLCFLNSSWLVPGNPQGFVSWKCWVHMEQVSLVYADGHVQKSVPAGPSTLTQRVSWAQGLGGHAAVHGEVEWLLHFGPDNSVRKGRKTSREKRGKHDWQLPQVLLPF